MLASSWLEALRCLKQPALVTTLLLGLLFSSLDASIVSTSLVSISLDLQDFLDAPWVVLSYLLAYLGFAIGFAKMSDIYGRRELLCVAWVLFAAFSIGCATAETMPQLIICRAFQGVGGSGLYSLAQVGLFEVGPSHKPSLLGALVGITLAVSFVLGPVLGGVISSKISWRWVFWINLPFGAVALAILMVAWPKGLGAGQSLRAWDAARKVDLLGNVLVVAASTLLVFALQEAGTFTYSWDSPPVVVSLCVACLSWVVFAVWELFLGLKQSTMVEPILPIRLITHRVYFGALLCTLFTGFVYLSILIIIPERFQIVNGEDALWSGIHLLPMLGATAFGSFLAGALSHRKNNTSITLVASSCFQLIGTGLLSTLSDVTTEIKAQYGYQVILGLGVGLSLGAATILTSVQARSDDLAVAQGAVAQARVFGGAVGIALCTIIFNHRVHHSLSNRLDPDDLQALHHSPTITSYLPPESQKLVRSIYALAFTDDILIMIGISALGVLASLLTLERDPPPMPTNATIMARRRDRANKDNRSDTELDELV